ncbi:sulfurtransferase [Tepidibacter hydrothermalis]|uniref:Rhodanese-like domain-containing protein n=1 Tax=Tepidibacter hydrothermalis TaxID=3036126 RepID=A0ABY8EHE7_9FIRM|nr:rhodanese-like domain-containing protein [Tepidibacter hydrothermalis]WFD10183.1 rhodanese-like domain-containing protein [Tepidibacter hydrothermalis]
MKKALIITLSLMMVIFGLAGCSNDDKKQEANNDSKSEYNIADTQKVEDALKDESWVVVDTRLNDAFNGWKLDGISRGGRIKGAVDFSANWLNVEVDEKKVNKEEVLNEALETKGITKDKNIVLYDANGKDSKEVAEYLKEKGFNNLYLYDVNKWADDDKLPMEKYKNYQLIVPASITKDVIDGKKPESFENAKNIKIVEASWGEEKTSYAKGHIPTSFHINTDEIEPPAVEPPMMWMLADDETLKSVALKYGFTKDDTVIVTGEEPMSSYRVATVLRYIGVNDVRVLNGGTMAWTMAGYELETTSNKATPVEDFGGVIPGNPDVIDTMEETKEGLKTPDKFTLVDNRTWDEYIGKSSGYSYHDKMGRVPGSVFGYAGKTDSYSLDYFRNIDKTMRNANEFLDLWKKQGIDTTKHLSFMCGSGWRVAEIYTYSDVVGLEDISIFSDGWIGWSNDSSNPTETGEPKK